MEGLRTYKHHAMDTEFSVSFPIEEDAVMCSSAAHRAFEEIDFLEGLLTKFSDTSDVAVIRGLKKGQSAVVDLNTLFLILSSRTLTEATEGAFDVTLDRRNLASLHVDEVTKTVTADEDSIELDFGGIAKGYALDRCVMSFEEDFGLKNWIIDAGTSTVLAKGPGPKQTDGRGWPITVGGRWRTRSKQTTTLFLTDGCAVSGSGTELRGSHIRDVRRHECAQVWDQSWCQCAWGETPALFADAFSTAALSLDATELKSLVQESQTHILVAHDQPCEEDALRDPLIWFKSLCGRKMCATNNDTEE